MRIKLFSMAFSLAVLSIGHLNAGDQASKRNGKSEVAPVQSRCYCELRVVELDCLKMRQLGVEIAPQAFDAKTTSLTTKNAEIFLSVIKSLVKNELAESTHFPSMDIPSGITASMSEKTDAREIELHLKPQIQPKGYTADFKIQVTRPDPAQPNVVHKLTEEFVWEGNLEETVVINVTKLFSGDSKNRHVFVLLTVGQQTNSSTQDR